MSKIKKAPGRPGTTPCWTDASKSGIGKALHAGSHITFSIARGALTEAYYPREDTACLGESFFFVTGPDKFCSDERVDTTQKVEQIHAAVPGYIVSNTCKSNKYRLNKNIISDPLRNCILQQVKFTNVTGKALSVHNKVVPRFPKDAKIRKAYVGKINGIEMLFAETAGMVMAMYCSVPFKKRSVGFLGTSDCESQIRKYNEIKHEYDVADNGNVCLYAEIDLASSSDFLLATAFGHSMQEAGHSAIASILTGYDLAEANYVNDWKHWHNTLWSPPESAGKFPLLGASANVLRVNESKLFPGGILASLSIPWGESRGGDSIGAYHLVWPRDLVLSAGGYAALEDKDSLLRILNYLMATQLENGSWPQNMWLDGKPHWNGVQLDQVAMPVSLVEFCHSHHLVSEDLLRRYWPGVKKALKFLEDIGPFSEQDRWEEESGVNTFSLATQVSAFVSGAKLAAELTESDLHQHYLEKADELNNRIDDLMYITDTPLSKEHGVDGYYIRMNPGLEAAEKIKNKKLAFKKPGSQSKLKVYECIGVDALALVRFGLRSPHDPKIVNTVKLIDALLKAELVNGTSWYRYVGDIYGEEEGGDAYKEGGSKGVGRPWPLLTGERAHYEIAAGNYEYAGKLIESLNNFASNGFLPEQVWDSGDLPDKTLANGKATGSAMPLTWAHSEYIKLVRSYIDKKVYDRPECAYERYGKDK